MNSTFSEPLRNALISSVTKNLIIIIMCVCINSISGVLISTFHKHEILFTNPRYILFIHMVINDMLQLVLTVLVLTLTYVLHHLPASVCAIFILFIIFTTENTPLNLACMALECYIAICHPLHHRRVCTAKRAHATIVLIWFVTVISGTSDLFITLQTTPTDFFFTKIVCLRLTVFPSPIVAQKRNYSFIVLLVVVWLVIFFAFFQVLVSAKAVSKDIKKARNTIVLHSFQVLLSMSMYVAPPLMDLLLRVFPQRGRDVRFAVYVGVHVLPRSLSPIVYGMKDTTFRKHIRICPLWKVECLRKPNQEMKRTMNRDVSTNRPTTAGFV